jgi:puromycin-sensitive aminopeptidase
MVPPMSPTSADVVDVGNRFRLSDRAVPVAYRIALEPDLERDTFDGRVEIDLELHEPGDAVVLHVIDLMLDAPQIQVPDGTVLTGVAELEPTSEIATLRFPQSLPAGRHVLRLAFHGTINEQLRGLYRSTYVDADGATRRMAATQLCVADARRTFPCFDEPAFKATFQLTVAAPAGHLVVSNTEVAAERMLGDGRHEVAFAPTMRMSSYLVALVVGPLERRVVDVDGVALSVVSTPGRDHLASFALEAGAFALRFFADYFSIPYPGTKLDLVAMPDFALGGMENFGCITFRESALLVDEATSTTEALQRVAMVVAHEIAHMWFGDLVTMQWWEGLWLNEAFATFCQYLCADGFRPTWQLWERFHELSGPGMEIDSLRATRAIEFPVHSPEDAMAMIDPITYMKGSAVLRMLEQFLGATTFREGIRRYLADHAYGNTVTADLWAALEAASGAPVGTIMDTWILQGGHPAVELRGSTCTQSPFRYATSGARPEVASTWQVPIRARSLSTGEVRPFVLGTAPLEAGLAAPVVLNSGFGFYRSAYDASGFAALAGRLDDLTALERTVFVSDTWALARASRASVGDLLAVARNVGDALEPSVWRTVEQALSMLGRIVADVDRPRFAQLVGELAGPLLERLGWTAVPDEPVTATVLRPLAIRLLGALGADRAVRAEATARFDAGALDGDVADGVVAVIAAMARPGDRDELLRRMDAATDPQTEERCRLGVADFADLDAGVETFRTCFDRFRLQDTGHVILRLVQNRVAGKAVWMAMTEQWDMTIARVPPLMQQFLVAGIATLVDDRAFAERVAAFHRTHPLPSGQQRAEQAIEWMLNGVAFAEHARPELRAILS